MAVFTFVKTNYMNWTEILNMLLPLLFGGGIATFATLRATRKRANAEADNTAIEGLRAAIAELRDMQSDSDRRDEKKDKLIAELQKALADKRCECTTKGYYMCIHQGCALRRPSLGRGKEYYKAHESDTDFGADYTPVEELLEEYKAKGERDGDNQ